MSDDEPAKRKVAETVISVDPGSLKCGVAVISGPDIQRLYLGVIESERLVAEMGILLSRFPDVSKILMGGGTGSGTLRRAVLAAYPHIPLLVVNEHGSSMRARQRFVAEIPAPGWRRFLPKGLRIPERPYDYFVALLLAEDYFLAFPGTLPTE